MKKMLQILFVLLMFCGGLSFETCLYAREVTQKEMLEAALGQLDMVAIVQTEMGEQYQLLGTLMDTDEFRDIVSTYTDGLIEYMIDGQTTVEITSEQLRPLFSHYSEILLTQYPELAFLPTDQFIDFLLGSMDINALLPSYETLVGEIPVEVQTLVKVVRSAKMTALSLAVFLVGLIGSLVFSLPGGLFWCGMSFLLQAGLVCWISYSEDFIFQLAACQPYLQLKPAVVWLLRHGLRYAQLNLIIGCMSLGIALITRKRGKKHA